MLTLNIKPTHKPIRNYYAELEEYAKIGAEHEGAVRTAFQNLLQHYCRQADLILVCEKTRHTKTNRRIQLDGEVVDAFNLPHGHWEAKDTHDDLPTEAQRKSEAGYPFKNIIVQSPTRALLYQDSHLRLDVDLTDPKNLINLLNTFFAYQEENIVDWYAAVEEFKEKVPTLGRGVAKRIETEMQNNPTFRQAFTDFHEQCRAAINPNLTEAQVEEMLIQHLLTERIFRTVFDNPDFTNRNIIVQEIEKVIYILTRRSPSRSEFLRPLNPFYIAIEKTAAIIIDFSQKQAFLNTVYEQFFQGFSVKVADYTYDEDGTNRRENITDWALTHFQRHYKDHTITKWDIFHYTYGLLHHPEYRERYQENLKRDLPHIPFAEDFWMYAKADARLADLHINYESQPEYDRLDPIETPGMQIDWSVERMKFSKDKTRLQYNDFLTLEGIPPEAFDYRLGNRAALEWVVDQYRIKTDKRSGIVNDPNRAEDPEYILRLIGQVITVSLETVKIIDQPPSLVSSDKNHHL